MALYQRYTMQPTDRLTALRDPDNPATLTREDVLELFDTFAEAEGYVGEGARPTLVEFGLWLAGNGTRPGAGVYLEYEPAEVLW
jgi:hypothetical protein